MASLKVRCQYFSVDWGACSPFLSCGRPENRFNYTQKGERTDRHGGTRKKSVGLCTPCRARRQVRSALGPADLLRGSQRLRSASLLLCSAPRQLSAPMAPTTRRVCLTALETTKNICFTIPTLEGIKAALTRFHHDVGACLWFTMRGTRGRG